MTDQRNTLFSIILAIVVITSITLGILLPVFTSIDIPLDSKLYIIDENENLASVNGTDFTNLTNKSLEISLLSFLEIYGITDFDHITIISTIDSSEIFYKNDLVDSTLKLGESGFLLTFESCKIDSVQGIAIDFEYSIVDIAPTIYQTLGFTDWSTEGNSISFSNSSGFSKTLLIHLDGFGWRFWENLTSLGIIELNLNILFAQPALTAYPSITNVATASMLSGYWPASTGITTRQNHILDVETIFDVAGSNNLITEIIEGSSGFLAIDADYESWLPDINESGSNDDEIFQKTIQSLNSSRADLLFTHFHGIDDVGHSFGPYSPEWLSKIEQVFDYLAEIMDYVDNETLIIISADHGMHLSESAEDYRLGTHGGSQWEDMLIPLIFARK